MDKSGLVDEREWRHWQRCLQAVLPVLVFIGCAVLVLLPDLAVASNAEQKLPWEENDGALTTFTNAFKGPIAYALSLAAIIGAGITLAFGGQFGDATQRMMYLALVIGVVVFAANIMGDVFGVGALV